MDKLFIWVIAFLYINCNVSGQIKESDAKSVKYNVSYLRAADDRIQQMKEGNNVVYKVQVRPGDISRNGNRAEIVLQFDSKIKHMYNYSWDFNISSKYSQRIAPKYHFIVA